jgi:hypothetical protein
VASELKAPGNGVAVDAASSGTVVYFMAIPATTAQTAAQAPVALIEL